jgi:hypothetical protein
MNPPIACLLAICSLVLVSCGGGGDDGGSGGTMNSTPPPPSTGNFVDSPVQGLQYTASPSGLSGVTGPDGEFKYQSGDIVTFTIGGATIGSAPAQPQITPFLGASIPSVLTDTPVNIAQLLLGLDTTPGSDRITLSATPPTLPPSTCIICSHFDTDMAAAGIPLASEADAITHLKRQFAIWGSWATAVSPNQLQVVTFMPDGVYMMADDDDPATVGGADGMERGIYRWDPSTNILSYTVVVDTDGTGGLSKTSGIQSPPHTFVIDASGNSATFRFGPNPADQTIFTRVVDPTKQIVGAWRLAHLMFDPAREILPFAVLTLLPDGTFMVSSDRFDSTPAGIERGTYVSDEASETLTLTTTVDTNGEFGVNDSATLPATLVVHADTRSSINGEPSLTTSEGPDVVTFFRIKAP